MVARESARVTLPILTRLILSEIAVRRGRRDEELLIELINKEALAELGEMTQNKSQTSPEGHS